MKVTPAKQMIAATKTKDIDRCSKYPAETARMTMPIFALY
jgi:hypothetical protein